VLMNDISMILMFPEIGCVLLLSLFVLVAEGVSEVLVSTEWDRESESLLVFMHSPLAFTFGEQV
jgi:hypothetical protein